MWEFEIRKRENFDEMMIIFGYNLADAFRRHSSLNPDEWECIFYEYVD